MIADRQIIWITGAGKGMGRTLALRLAGDGHQVAVSARTETDLNSLVAEAAGLPGEIVSFPLDITNADDAASTIDAIEKRIAPIDLAILNAGTHQAMWLDEFDVDKVRRLIDVNFMGTVNCLAPLMKRFKARTASTGSAPTDRGHIAVVASVAGYRGLPSAGAYSASKAGLIALCESLKPELDAVGIRLTLINPGFVDTPLTRQNDFEMPFLISEDAAVDHIMKGLRKTGFEIVFPLPMKLIMGALRMLPDRLFFYLTRRMVRK